MDKIRISGVEKESTVDGPGFRYVLFTQGCTHNCAGCHNVETHDIDGGIEVEINEIIKDIKTSPYLTGVTFSGGDPIVQSHKLIELSRQIKLLGLNLIIYTGYTFEDLLALSNNTNKLNELLAYVDILIDGKFILQEKDLTLAFKGSTNQRAIDVQKSLRVGKAVVLENDEFVTFFM